MKRLILLLLLATQFSTAQVYFKIINSETKEPLVNIPVRFGEKNGIYSNAKGEVTIPQEYEVDSISISALGFEPYLAKVIDIQDTSISLIPLAYDLPEVVLRGKPKKVKTVKQRAIRSNSAFRGTQHLHGVEFGILIPKVNSDSDVQLMEITIPIISKSIDRKRLNKDRKNQGDDKAIRVYSQRNRFSYLYQINFYHKISDTVFERIDLKPIDLIINDQKRRYKIDLEDKRIFSNELGIMVGVQNLGPCDEKGVMLPIPRYSNIKHIAPDGREFKMIYNIDSVPLFGTTNRRKDNSVNYKHLHISEKSEWYKLKDKSLGWVVGGNSNQLSLGYKLKVITY